MIKLKELRGKHNQTKIAKALGIAQTTYSGYERGESEPDIETLKRISGYFGVSIDYLLNNEIPLKGSFEVEKNHVRMRNKQGQVVTYELSQENADAILVMLEGLKL